MPNEKVNRQNYELHVLFIYLFTYLFIYLFIYLFTYLFSVYSIWKLLNHVSKYTIKIAHG